MAHYAFLNDKNVVVEVIVGIDETETIEGLSPEEWYSNFRGLACKRTSYSGSIRKHFAGIGFTYDKKMNAFIPPKPFPSWVLEKTTATWQPPVEYPVNGQKYKWNEELVDWELDSTPDLVS
jgi:hypothetical protein